jgi:hypothetical protein
MRLRSGEAQKSDLPNEVESLSFLFRLVFLHRLVVNECVTVCCWQIKRSTSVRRGTFVGTFPTRHDNTNSAPSVSRELIEQSRSSIIASTDCSPGFSETIDNSNNRSWIWLTSTRRYRAGDTQKITHHDKKPIR